MQMFRVFNKFKASRFISNFPKIKHVSSIPITIFAGSLALYHYNKQFNAEENIDNTLLIDTILLKNAKLQRIKQEGDAILRRFREQYGIPGIVVCVMMDEKIIWEHAIGYADVENLVPMKPNSVLRIASISKSLTATAIGILLESKKIDIDAPIQKYLPEYPTKHIGNQPITTRLLLSHLSGIRHYKGSEFLSKKHYKDVKSTFHIFQNDELNNEPGEKYNYSTYGYNIISAIIEAASGEEYLKFMREKIFNPLGMTSTRPERHEEIVPNKAKFYRRNSKHLLENAPYVDNSLKWAGGGFISTARDICVFGNAIIHHALLKPETMQEFFTPQRTKSGEQIEYGLGFYYKKKTCMLHELGKDKYVLIHEPIIGHSGGAVGSSSHLMMLPNQKIVVCIIVNLEGIGLYNICLEIANLFSMYKYSK